MVRSKVFQAWLGFFAMLVVLIGFAYSVWTSIWEASDDVVS